MLARVARLSRSSRPLLSRRLVHGAPARGKTEWDDPKLMLGVAGVSGAVVLTWLWPAKKPKAAVPEPSEANKAPAVTKKIY